MNDKEQGGLGWSTPYDFDIAVSIDTGSTGRFKYTPDFIAPYCLGKCTISMTGSRHRDYLAAETVIRRRRNRGETWHHVFPQGGVLPMDIYGNYYCEMELVLTHIHRQCCPHLGAVYLYPGPYRMIETAGSIVWQEVATPLQSPPDLAKILWGYSRSYVLAIPSAQSRERVYIETIYNEEEAQGAIQDMCVYPWFDKLITDLGWYPIGEDALGNILLWKQGNTIFEGVLIYILHDECVKGECKFIDVGSSCKNEESFKKNFLIPLSALL
jgi:hypothetical protein